jgi:hypothetical protein
MEIRHELEEILKAVYAAMSRQLGHKLAGEIIGRVCYPALVEAGWKQIDKS